MKPVKDSEILRAVRRRIATGKSTMICLAIDALRVGQVKQKTALKSWINHMLEGSIGYITWVQRHHVGMYREMVTKPGSFRAARLAWLDWMIDYCEKEEAGEHNT